MSDVLVTYEVFTHFAADQGFETVDAWLDAQGGSAWKPGTVSFVPPVPPPTPTGRPVGHRTCPSPS